MKNKGHVIAKIILTLVLSFAFSYCLVMIKTLEDENPGRWKKEKKVLLEKHNSEFQLFMTLKTVSFIDAVIKTSREK